MCRGKVNVLVKPCCSHSPTHTHTHTNNDLLCTSEASKVCLFNYLTPCAAPVQLGDHGVRLMTEMSKHTVFFLLSRNAVGINKSVNTEGTGVGKKDRCYLQNRYG